jgi:hypothetical protein
MAIDALGSISPIAQVSSIPSAVSRAAQSRPPETTPEAREAASQENDARRTAAAESGASPAYLAGPQESSSPSAVGTRVYVQASADTETTLRASSAEISRAYAGSETSAADMRSASEAYQAASAARSDMARQQQGDGSQGINILA